MRNYNQQYAENQELSVFKDFFINKGKYKSVPPSMRIRRKYGFRLRVNSIMNI